MKRDRDYLINMYNATSTGDENDELETYEAWLEKQLLRRLDRIEELEAKEPTIDDVFQEEEEFHSGKILRAYLAPLKEK